MPAAIPVIAAVSGAVGVAATVKSLSAQRKEARLRKQQQEVATRRSRRQAIRQAQITRAQAIATAQGQGALTSSSAQGGIGAIGSQLGEQLGFSTQMSALSRDIGSAASDASLFGSLGQLGFTGFQQFGGFGALSELAPNQATVPTGPISQSAFTRQRSNTPPFFNYDTPGVPQ